MYRTFLRNTPAVSAGVSWRCPIASNPSRPKPSKLKITSIKKLPVKNIPTIADGKPAIIIIIALRNT
jgi:hypothetical protein